MTGMSRSRIVRAVRRGLLAPRVTTVSVAGLCRLGSAYGGWVFADRPDLHGSVILSCGLGEDASFDVEFASKYAASVVIVDPTPRAVEHFERVVERVWEPAACAYSSTGSQPVEAYDLSSVSRDQLTLLPVALADHVGSVRFFAPPDSSAVSHSIVNFQNRYSQETRAIDVACIDVKALRKEMGGALPGLVKMDIEGAEILVLPEFIAHGWLPHQLLVEFDELNFPSRRGRNNFDRVDALIREAGYAAIHWDRRSCVSYLRTDCL